MVRKERGALLRFTLLSMAAALAGLGLKYAAYSFTGSVGILSDTLDSLANLTTAVAATVFLRLAARQPDQRRRFGYDKVEYFACAFEGAVLLGAAATIVWSTYPALLKPTAPSQLDLGLALAVTSAALNLLAASSLWDAGRRYDSLILKAEARHLFTDVLVTSSLVMGLLLAQATGLALLDPLLALGVAIHVFSWGVGLLRTAWNGLLDTALEEEELELVRGIFERYQVEYHALRTRQAGSRRFLSVHILVPGEWTVQKGHDLVEEIEKALVRALPGLVCTTHLEPLEDASSFFDQTLERREE